jgi:AcrR family transcriptional regulator
MAITQQPKGDGRVARRDRNRNTVLDAALELFGEDNLEPTPEQVAARSGLSLRSVYRYFEDRDGLLRAAIDRRLETVIPLVWLEDLGEGPRPSRIERIVTSRVRLYEEAGPTARASRRRALTNEVIRESVERTHRTLQAQVERHFAPEIDVLDPDEGDALASAIDVLLQLEACDHLTLVRHLDLDQVHHHLVFSLTALLAAADRP